MLEEVGNTAVSSTLKTELRSSMEQSVDSRAQERVVGPFRAGLEVVGVGAKLEEEAVDIQVSEQDGVIDVLRWDCAWKCVFCCRWERLSRRQSAVERPRRKQLHSLVIATKRQRTRYAN